MEYIYKLILIDRLFTEDNWIDEDEMVIKEHVKYLRALEETNVLIMAGKTTGIDDTTYGLVLFRAPNYEKAKAIMSSDPAISKGIMRGKLHQFNVSMYNNNFTKK